MCGICGVIALPLKQAELAHAERMAQAIIHRGPDGEGVIAQGRVALGHRRLTIIDLETGDQPLTSASGRTVLAYNGEVYNYRRLREQLIDEGFSFRTTSDTEVVAVAYEAWGEASFERLEGMFAFALFDRAQSRCYLVRDRAGIKPLYVASSDAGVLFASELKAILTVESGARDLSREALNAYFFRQYIGGEQTIYRGIERLAPGTFWRFDVSDSAPLTSKGVVRFAEYTKDRPTVVSLEDAEARLEQSLTHAVSDHLQSDVPVGIFLSGGVDSSLLVAIAQRIHPQPLKTFSVGFGEDRFDELGYAGRVAETFGTEHHEIRVSAEEGLRLMPEICAALDQPLADYAIVPTLAMSRFAAEHVKVALGGEGADELFAGYPRYIPCQALPSTRLLPRKHLPLGPRLFADAARRQLLGDRFLPAQGLPTEVAMHRDLREHYRCGAVNAVLTADLKHWLVGDLLVKMDEMGMLASLEVRVPYLDQRLVAEITRLPGNLKVRGQHKKLLLRRLAARYLPREIVDRKKHGFTVPVGNWLRGPLAPAFREKLTDGHPLSAAVEMTAVRRLWREHQQGKDHGRQLWAVFVLGAWLETHSHGQVA